MNYFEIEIGDLVYYSGDFCAEGVVVDKTATEGLPHQYCIGVDFGSNAPPKLCHPLLDRIAAATMLNVELPTCTGWWCEPKHLQLLDNEVHIPVTSATVLNFLGFPVSEVSNELA